MCGTPPGATLTGFFIANEVTFPEATTRNDWVTASKEPSLFQARMATKMKAKPHSSSTMRLATATTMAASSGRLPLPTANLSPWP